MYTKKSLHSHPNLFQQIQEAFNKAQMVTVAPKS